MTAEERATTVLNVIAAGCNDDVCKGFNAANCGCFSAIASAIREAEDAAIDLCAAAAAGRILYAFDKSLPREAAAVDVAENVRQLRHPTVEK